MLLADFKKLKIEAMKAHDEDAVKALNVVINKLMLASIEKRAKGEEMNDTDTVAILQKTEKELLEERAGYEKAGRADTVASLDKQIAAVKKYMPQMMSQEEIKEVILSLSDRSVPAVMKHFKTNFAGKCEMKTVSEVLKSL